MAHTYEVRVRQDGKFWFIEIPELDGATQARNVREIEEMAKDYIALATDVDVDTVSISVEVSLPTGVQMLLDEAEAERKVEAAARARAAALSRDAVRTLTTSGLSMRDVGSLLGVSHQRVQQLVSAKPADQEPSRAR